MRGLGGLGTRERLMQRLKKASTSILMTNSEGSAKRPMSPPQTATGSPIEENGCTQLESSPDKGPSSSIGGAGAVVNRASVGPVVDDESSVPSVHGESPLLASNPADADGQDVSIAPAVGDVPSPVTDAPKVDHLVQDLSACDASVPHVGGPVASDTQMLTNGPTTVVGPGVMEENDDDIFEGMSAGDLEALEAQAYAQVSNSQQTSAQQPPSTIDQATTPHSSGTTPFQEHSNCSAIAPAPPVYGLPSQGPPQPNQPPQASLQPPQSPEPPQEPYVPPQPQQPPSAQETFEASAPVGELRRAHSAPDLLADEIPEELLRMIDEAEQQLTRSATTPPEPHANKRARPSPQVIERPIPKANPNEEPMHRFVVEVCVCVCELYVKSVVTVPLFVWLPGCCRGSECESGPVHACAVRSIPIERVARRVAG